MKIYYTIQDLIDMGIGGRKRIMSLIEKKKLRAVNVASTSKNKRYRVHKDDLALFMEQQKIR